MNRCKFCGKNRPEGRPKFCSRKCVKRDWYVRNLPSGSNSSLLEEAADFDRTETGIGLRWEKYVANLLGAKHILFNHAGADLLLNGRPVDVKAANLYRRKNKRGRPVVKEQSGVWVFNRNKPKEIDWFVCVCLRDDKPEKILMIPGTEFPKSGAVIGIESRYDKFSIPF